MAAWLPQAAGGTECYYIYTIFRCGCAANVTDLHVLHADCNMCVHHGLCQHVFPPIIPICAKPFVIANAY